MNMYRLVVWAYFWPLILGLLGLLIPLLYLLTLVPLIWLAFQPLSWFLLGAALLLRLALKSTRWYLPDGATAGFRRKKDGVYRPLYTLKSKPKTMLFGEWGWYKRYQRRESARLAVLNGELDG